MNHGANDDAAFAAKRRRLEEMAARLGTGVDALALAAVLARPWVDVVLSGDAIPGQLSSNLAALSVAWDRQADEMAHGLAEGPEEYWSTRARLPWN